MILLLVRVVRFLVILLLVRLALRFVGAVVEGYRQSRPAAQPADATGATTLVRDRVCDTFLPRSRALVATVDGHEQHFCSPACRDRALRLAP
jgi:hypothetical protein